MSKMGERQRFLLFLLPLLIAVAGFLLCFLQYMEYQEASRQLRQEEQLLAAVRKRLAGAEELAGKEEEYTARLGALQQLLPLEPAEERLLADLQDAADLAFLELQQVRFGEREEKEGYIEIPLQIALGGSFDGLLNFLDFLQGYGRALRINEIKVEQAGEGEDLATGVQAAVFMLLN